MSKINRHPVRRTAAGVLAGALALSGAVAAGSPAFAGPNFALERIAGDNRYETSAAIAAAFGPSTGAILASGETGRSVDALSANFLAGVQGVPVLLTQRDRVPAAVLARLNALTGAKNVTIVGGTVAVSAAVETQLRTAGFTVTRLGGDDRYATSEAIITAGRASANPIGIVASGLSFPDALAGAPLSYKGKHPVFLTSGASIPQDTIDAMVAAGTRQVIILGGTAAVPASVEAALATRGITVVTRLGGAGRSETSRIVADYLINNLGFTNTTFNLASGAPRSEGVDALSGGALSGQQNRALLITDTPTQAAPVVAFARDRSATLNATGNIFGGTAAVAVALEEAIEAAGRSAPNFQTLSVSPATAATLTVVNDTAPATNDVADDRTYTASGLTNGTTYRVTLVNNSSITVGANGQVSFLSEADTASSTGFSAVTGADVADIIAVNGTVQAAGTNTATVTPVNGNISFTINGTAPGSVTPVLYVNGAAGGTGTTGGTTTRLEINATATALTGTPAETFGVGGTTTYVAPQAPNGAVGGTAAGAAAGTIDKTANSFTTGTGGATVRYNYDANDLFTVNGVSVGLDAFEAALSSGDTITGTFTRDPAGVSTFNLTDVNPPAATATATVGQGANSRNVTVTASFAGDVDQVVVQRAPVTGNTGGSAGTVGTFATIATAPATDTDAAANGVQVSYTDVNVALGSYQYRVAGINDGDQGEFGAASATVTTTAPAADTTGPTATATSRITDGGLANLLDAGDVFTIRANETLAAPANGSVIRVTDAATPGAAGASVADLVCGTNATCTVNAAAIPANATNNAGAAAGTVLTVTVTAPPTVVTAGDVSGIAYPAVIINTGGINDVAGNRLNLSTGDLTIN